MPYTVHTFEEVEAYLHCIPGLSAHGHRRLVEAYLRDLAEHADEYLARAPLAPEAYTFQYDYVLTDGGVYYRFRFIVDGSGMPYGVVQVVYADYEAKPGSP